MLMTIVPYLEGVKFFFSKIDHKNPDKEFSFTIRLEDETYKCKFSIFVYTKMKSMLFSIYSRTSCNCVILCNVMFLLLLLILAFLGNVSIEM